jgi:arabinogalactan endo-1,4-beta-galactosidase
MKYFNCALFIVCFPFVLGAQSFYTGADLSYVNEMETCGASFRENNISKDPYQIFADHGCNLIRLRLWHTPSWYDTLNTGNRYSDLTDVKQSIQRAKNANMQVLLDFHLSDTWADPGKQIVPAAWSAIVDDLDLLQDSLYQYIYGTLEQLYNENLLPDIIQIGNEVNRGILQSEAANQAGWALDWDRNGVLFKRAIEAVRDIETISGTDIPIALHISGPDSGDWYFENFIAQGVTDFQFIGLSYYTQWHGDLSFAQMADYITQLKNDYDREVLIMEVGYPWTDQNIDGANNILNVTHPNYQPFSPARLVLKMPEGLEWFIGNPPGFLQTVIPLGVMAPIMIMQPFLITKIT